MSGYVGKAFGLIVTLCNNAPPADYNRAYGYLILLKGKASLLQGHSHEVFVGQHSQSVSICEIWFFTSVISQRGVDVAPHIPIFEASSNHSA